MAGMADAMFAELMAVAGMANETNRLANGYQVEIDERCKTQKHNLWLIMFFRTHGRLLVFP
jgi:hypothetical protein